MRKRRRARVCVRRDTRGPIQVESGQDEARKASLFVVAGDNKLWADIERSRLLAVEAALARRLKIASEQSVHARAVPHLYGQLGRRHARAPRSAACHAFERRGQAHILNSNIACVWAPDDVGCSSNVEASGAQSADERLICLRLGRKHRRESSNCAGQAVEHFVWR